MSHLYSYDASATCLFAVFASLAFGTIGCDVKDALETDTHSAASAVDGSETILAEVDVDYGVIHFHELTAPDGTQSLAVSEMAPATLVTTPLETLLSQDNFTALEIFKAVAPDLQVPPAIADAHPYEAAALGRADDSIVKAHFDKRAPSPKSVASCESFVYEDPDEYNDWYNKLGRTNVSGSWWLNVGTVVDDWSYSTTGYVTLGVCNDSDVAISGRIAHDDTADSSGWIYWGIATVNPGWSWRWWNFSKSYWLGDWSMARISYGVWGSSLTGKLFHLRTAVRGAEQCTTSDDCPTGYRCYEGACQAIIN